jgi:sulfonate transport system permease protein
MLSRAFQAVPRPLRGWVLPALPLALWWAALQWQWTSSPLLVSPLQVWHKAVELMSDGEAWLALGSSLKRDLLGLFIGASAGLIFGGVLGLSRWSERLFGPSFQTLKQISLFAWLPLISLWFGLGDPAKVAFIALASFFPVVLNTFEGIRATPPDLVEVARVLRFSRVQLLTRVVLPAAAPAIFTGLHLGLIYAWLATLGAEYLMVAGPGIGSLLVDGRDHFWMDQVLFGVILVGSVGVVLNTLAALVERRVLAWRGRSAGLY